MGATAAAVTEFFAAAAPEAATATAAASEGAALEAGMWGIPAGATGAAAGGSGILGAAASAGASALATGLVQKSMMPKPPKVGTPLAMPDPLAQEQARRRSLQEQAARSGRASTMLTSPTDAGGKLGG